MKIGQSITRSTSLAGNSLVQGISRRPAETWQSCMSWEMYIWARKSIAARNRREQT